MKIYLNMKNTDSSIYSTLKSSGKVTAFYPTTSFTISHFYIKTVFTIEFLLTDYRSLPYIPILDLLSDKPLGLLVPILST